MDPGLSPDLIAAIVTLVGVTGSGVLAYVLVKKARAARRRQIEAAGEQRSVAKRPGRPNLLPEEEPEAKPQAEPQAEPEDGPQEIAARAPAAPRPEDAQGGTPSPREEPRTRPPAQVLPFPTPTAHALPVDKPAAPTPAPRPKVKDGSALAPGLARTRSGWVARLGEVFAGRREIDPALVDEIEKVLLTADIGVRTSQKLLEEIRSSLGKQEIKEPSAIWSFLRQRSSDILAVGAPALDLDAARPFVLLVIGVNGSGKTTTIGKLASQFKTAGKRVLLAAGDTFRAAATEQLEVWGQRVDVPVVRGKEGADPSSVLFDAVKRAKAEDYDVVIADTAGRLHTKTELMDELQKVRRVIGKAHEGAPHETWLVIDATNGQNAIAQAQIFTQAMAVSGIVLTKLDGTAKGGVILGIADQLRLPVRYIGVGERIEDLRAFDPDEFVEALFQAEA